MAFSSTQSRNFTNHGHTSPPDLDRNNSAITSSLGNGAGPWGNKTSSIWGNGNSNAFMARGADKARSSNFDNEKKGSGSLLESSESDTWTPQSRGDSAVRLAKNGLRNNAEIPRALSNASSISPTTTRAPAVNITNPAFPHTRSTFAPGSALGFFGERPNVYTKSKDTPPQTAHPGADSAISPSSGSVSPLNDRKPQWLDQYHNMSVPGSRNVSRPPLSSHSDRQYSLPNPDHSRPSQRLVTANGQHNLSNQRNGSLGSLNFVNPDYLPSAFGQMSLGDDRPQSARSAQSPLSYQNDYQRDGFFDAYQDRSAPNSSHLHSAPFGMTQHSNTSFLPPYQASNTSRVNQSFQFTDFKPKADDRNRQMSVWHDNPENNGTLVRHGSNIQEESFFDPNLASQMMEFKVQTHAYNPFNIGNSMMAGLPQYINYYPMNIGLPTTLPAPADLNEPGVQSAKLFEFKNNSRNNRRFEIKDIYDHIAEFAGDQHGSRFIQTKLETANSDEKDRVFREIEPNAIPLMTDVFGNYVIQKFFDHGHQEHKRVLANKMRGQVLNLSTQMYGCRVVQKALEHVLLEQQQALIGELEHHILKCVKDQNGNHVIQKAIERCPAETIGFVYQSFVGQVHSLSLHPYGCRVIQRCLERGEWFPAKPLILAELHESMPKGMIADPYGNYVVQHVVQKGPEPDRQHVLAIVLDDVVNYSRHKFASNVVEVCVAHADDAWRKKVVDIMVIVDHRHPNIESTLSSLIKDNFGNYVIQKLLDCLSFQDFISLHSHLAPALAHAKRTGSGKQVISIEKKMSRFDSAQIPSPTSRYIQPPQMPYMNNMGSVANTPPPLISDNQSLQSSTIPSVDGDTVEGAISMSRKGSEAPVDGVLLR